jgi:spermidine/putrescine transport system substrate-binding protein
MYYIGYTSVISGGEDTTVFDYADWYYGAEEESEDNISYDIGHFFTDKNNEEYIITASTDQIDRGLYTQYPSEEVLKRCTIMNYFNPEVNTKINQMWINVRCFDFR